MTDQAAKGEAATPKTTPAADTAKTTAVATTGKTATGGSAGTVLSVLALLIGVGLAVAGWFTWQQLQGDTARQQNAVAAAQQRSEELDAQLRAQTDAFTNRIETLEGEQAALQDALTGLRTSVGRNQAGWMLAEVQYLMRVANQRLQMDRDPATALAALQAADQRLQELADPGLLAVRQQLEREIAALRAVPTVDVAGVVLQLDELARRADSWPMKGTQYTPPPPGGTSESGITITDAKDWRELPTVIWNALRQLVSIRHHDQPVGPMLAPERQYFLYQNLRLQLEAARVAVLRGQAESYQASVTTARDWLQEYFDAEQTPVASAIEQLTTLAEIEITPELPDISLSLRQLREQLISGAAATPTPPAATVGSGAPAL